MTSQRFSLKEIIFICQDGAKNNTQIFVTLITHIWRMLAWGVGIHVSLGMHAQDEPLPCACPCFQLVCRLVRSATQELKGLFFSETGLAALKAATGMRGSTSLLWQCTVEHTHTSVPSWHIHYLSFSPLLSINMPAFLSFLLLFTPGT